jgi:hypothetical protein
MTTFKKLSATLMMAALTAAFSACSSDDIALDDEEVGEEALFTITCQAPEMATSSEGSRAYSDGKTADNLYYALYRGSSVDAKGDTVFTLVHTNVETEAYAYTAPSGAAATRTVMKESSIKFDKQDRPQATLPLRLVLGQRYMLVAFGAATHAPYILDVDNKTIKVDYTNAVCNDESRDGFYKTFRFVASKKNGSSAMTITLTRPFAQVNVGTHDDDWRRAVQQQGTPSQTYFKVERVYGRLNVVTGEVDEQTNAEFAYGDIPDGETFPYSSSHMEYRPIEGQDPNVEVPDTYRYLAMNYVLVNTKESFTCYFKADNFEATKDEMRWDNVPMERNHRTNIFGSGILSMDENVTVVIDPEYITPAYDYTGSQQLLNNFADVDGATINLLSDVTLTAPITINGTDEATIYTLNLNGHTISYAPTEDNTSLFDVNCGTLIINGPGTVESDGTTYGHSIADVEQTGCLVINGGTFVKTGTDPATSADNVLFRQNGEDAMIVINGGDFYNQDDGHYPIYPVSEKNVIVTGGNFYEFNPNYYYYTYYLEVLNQAYLTEGLADTTPRAQIAQVTVPSGRFQGLTAYVLTSENVWTSTWSSNVNFMTLTNYRNWLETTMTSYKTIIEGITGTQMDKLS